MWSHFLDTRCRVEARDGSYEILFDVKLIHPTIVSQDIAQLCSAPLPSWKKRGLFVFKGTEDTLNTISKLSDRLNLDPTINRIYETHLVESEPGTTKLLFFYGEKR